MLEAIFEKLKKLNKDLSSNILTKASYIEIYNENLVDLLTD
jgi:hypothetical protein